MKTQPDRTGRMILIGFLVCNTAVAAPDMRSSGLFTRADVTGPDSTFVTQVMSDPDGLILTQHDHGGLRLVAGFDAGGTWLFDPASGEIRAIGDQWQVFLIGHDLHRLWLAPETRWTRAGSNFIDTAGRKARFSRIRAGRPTRLDFDDDEGQPIRVKFSGPDDTALFREAVIETGGGDYVYSYTKSFAIARELAPATPAAQAHLELGRLHRLQRMAHLGELPDLLTSSPDPLLEIASGQVSEVEPADLRARFTLYFDSVEFADWRDRTAPVLLISDDRTMASKAVEKSVVIDGRPRQEFAWLETWQRRDGAWRLTAIASTLAQ